MSCISDQFTFGQEKLSCYHESKFTTKCAINEQLKGGVALLPFSNSCCTALALSHDCQIYFLTFQKTGMYPEMFGIRIWYIVKHYSMLFIRMIQKHYVVFRTKPQLFCYIIAIFLIF